MGEKHGWTQSEITYLESLGFKEVVNAWEELVAMERPSERFDLRIYKFPYAEHLREGQKQKFNLSIGIPYDQLGRTLDWGAEVYERLSHSIEYGDVHDTLRIFENLKTDMIAVLQENCMIITNLAI